MSCNPNYDNFNFHTCSKQQNMYKNLYQEMVKKYGVKCKYLPANVDTGLQDDIFGENREAVFDQAIEISLFFSNYDKYEGEGDIFNRFGISFDDELELWISKLTTEEMNLNIAEGDLVYISMVDAMFEITFVEHEDPFYLLGVQMAYKIKLKKYRKSAEDEFDTSGLSDEDFLDIVREESGSPDVNVKIEDEADVIKDDDTNEEGNIFGNW